jgi:hypothetical protein
VGRTCGTRGQNTKEYISFVGKPENNIKKLKFSLCLIKLYAMKTYGGVEV